MPARLHECRFGDLVALDLSCPVGRYTLNLSRNVDRLLALRLQVGLMVKPPGARQQQAGTHAAGGRAGGAHVLDRRAGPGWPQAHDALLQAVHVPHVWALLRCLSLQASLLHVWCAGCAQVASALEHSWAEDKYYVNWLNAQLNGQPLDRQGLMRVCAFTLPQAGVLRLDYVSYRRPDPRYEPPATPDALRALLAELRACHREFMAAQLQQRGLAAAAMLPSAQSAAPAPAAASGWMGGPLSSRAKPQPM